MRNLVKERFYDYICDNNIEGVMYKNKTTVTVLVQDPVSQKAKKHHITVKDIIVYYNPNTELGCNGMSGCRQVGTFVHDWRYVDNVVKSVHHILEYMNRKGFDAEMRKMGVSRR